MRFADTMSALVQGFIAGAFGLPIYYQNQDTGEITTTHARLWFMPADSNPSTTGPKGRDLSEGIMQVDLMYPAGDGIGDAVEKADQISAYFQAGRRLLYNGQDVIIRGTSIAPPIVDHVSSRGNAQGAGFLKLAVSIRYSAYTRRSL